MRRAVRRILAAPFEFVPVKQLADIAETGPRDSMAGTATDD
jgi:hypothetical protein